MKRYLILINCCLLSLSFSSSLSASGGAGWDYVFRAPIVDAETFVQNLLDRDGRLARFNERFGNQMIPNPEPAVIIELNEEDFIEEVLEDDIAPVYVGAAPDVLYQNSEAAQRLARMQEERTRLQIAQQQANQGSFRDEMAQRMELQRQRMEQQMLEEAQKKADNHDNEEAAAANPRVVNYHRPSFFGPQMQALIEARRIVVEEQLALEELKKEEERKKKEESSNDEEHEIIKVEARKRSEADIRFEALLKEQLENMKKRTTRLTEIRQGRKTRSQSLVVNASRPKPLDDQPMSHSATLLEDSNAMLDLVKEDEEDKKEEEMNEDEEVVDNTTNHQNVPAPVAFGWRLVGYGTLWGGGQPQHNAIHVEEEIVEVTPREQALDRIALVGFVLRVGTPTGMLDSQLLGQAIGLRFYQEVAQHAPGFRTLYYMEALVALVEELYNETLEVLANHEELYDDDVIGDALNDIQAILAWIGDQRTVQNNGVFREFPNMPKAFIHLKNLIYGLALKQQYEKSDDELFVTALNLVLPQLQAKKEAFESPKKEEEIVE